MLQRHHNGLLEELARKDAAIAELKESKARFSAMFDGAAIGIALTGLHRRPMRTNKALQRMLGYSAEELSHMSTMEMTHPDDVSMEAAVLDELIEGVRPHAHYEKRYRHKDGHLVWAEVALSLIRDPDGNPSYSLCMVQDITARKQAEIKLRQYEQQLRSLAMELSLAELRERRRIATYLHDHIAQTLSFTMMKLEVLKQKPPSEELYRSMDKARQLIQEVVQEVRTMIIDLNPPVLEDLGFRAALEWLADKMRERYGLVVYLDDQGAPPEFCGDLSGFVFRALQELLVNVVKHGGGGPAWVRLSAGADKVRISVEDRGDGFQVEGRRGPLGSDGKFGLFSIKERLKHLGGGLHIESRPMGGSRVSLVVPLPSGPQEGAL